ncbi:PLP-dependent aminotransferase family protein [Pedobacter sp. SYP-B3415]|uniref:MocR-like pyridoxine biosynthesis transcription factor PdxR n=1 Tax=Pedobacter sp. SYP-B3415 TaxID=2496641 RepID=UPI00101D0281|nr:PLP-dependent aminotransferase family protein [Pedobacter sp. SYP-B3415]
MLRPWDLQININVHCERAIYVQIADAVIDAIKSGKLQSGDALPGSRQLATQLKLNRNTIIDALDLLLAEGWLEARERRGTFVSGRLPFPEPHADTGGISVASPAQPKIDIIFDDGVPDTRIAPIAELAAAYRQIFSRKGRWQMMGYSNASGDPDFKEAIVRMLNYKRGMRLSAPEVFVTRGSQMAMYLAAHSLLKPGDLVAVENPGYKPAWQAFQHAGARLLAVGVDAEGLKTDELKILLEANHPIKAVYTTPHHQFPTTVTLSLQRRQELITLSNKYGFTIIEDDYDNEFHFGQQPVLPLSSSENAAHFIYIGTMSKIVAPALRIGYLASSAGLISRAAEHRKIIDAQGDNMMEQAVLQLINEGHIKRHLRKATQLYERKRDLFDNLIRHHLDGKVKFRKPDGGLAFWLEPNEQTDFTRLTASLNAKGVQILHPESFSFADPVNGMRLGYASLNEAELERGIKTIAGLL